MNKDKLYRNRKDENKNEVTMLLETILGSGKCKTRMWDKKTKAVKEARELLDNPHFLLKRLASSMKNMTFSHDHDVRKVESALQVLQSIFQQDSAKETHEFPVDHIPPDGNEYLRMKDFKELQKEMEESTSFGEELKQIMAMLEQKHQSLTKALVYTSVARFLQKVVDSCMEIAENDILSHNCAPQVEGHRGVEIQEEHFKLSFPQTPDSIQISEKGENVEVHNPEMIVEDKQEKEVVLTLRSEEGRLAELKLAKKITNQEKGSPEENSTDEWFNYFLKVSSSPDFLVMSPMEDGTAMKSDEGTSNAAGDEANVKLSPDEISCKDNDIVLSEIMQEHPNILGNPQLSSPHFLDCFLRELAQIYQKIIKGNPEMLKLEDINIMEEMVQDMEHNGLQVSWLQEKLVKSRKKLESQEAMSKLLERSKLLKRINSCKAETEGTEQELAHSAKKPRFQ